MGRKDGLGDPFSADELHVNAQCKAPKSSRLLRQAMEGYETGAKRYKGQNVPNATELERARLRTLWSSKLPAWKKRIEGGLEPRFAQNP